MIVRPYAIPVRRAGTKYVGPVRAGNAEKDVRLKEFVFSVDQSNIIEMGEYYFRLKDSSGQPVIYDLDSAPDWADTTVYTTGTVVEQSSSVAAWSVGPNYDEGVYVTNDSVTYVCIQFHHAGFINEPGFGAQWEQVWEIAGTPHSYFICTKDHTSAAADNEPQSGTDWEDFWYEMALAGGLTGEWEVEVTTPYSEAQIWDVDYAQKNDVIKLTHNQHDIGELRRYADNVWAFVQGVIEGPPWQDLNEELDHKIRVNGTDIGTGKWILATGFEPFTPSDVGRYFRIGPLEAVSGEQGYFKATAFTSSVRLEGENIVKLQNDDNTSAWARNAFYTDPVTGYKNYPAHVTFHEGRLVLAGTTDEAAKLWFSKSFIYNDFNVGDTVAFGFDMQANTAQANKIEWISSSSTLATGTFGAEFSSESSADTGLNNDTKNIREQSAWGSDFVKPVKIGSRLYYVQRTGRKLREYVYSFDVNSFQSLDMTEYSDHITLSGIVDMHYQRNQDSLNWCVLENGNMAILSRQPNQEIQAWTPWSTTNGDAKSIRFIPNPDGASDRGFVLVEREIDGSIVKYIEYFDNHVIEDDTRQEDLYYVDCGVAYNQYTPTIGNNITVTFVGGPATIITADDPIFVAGDAGHNIRIVDSNGDTLYEGINLTYSSSTVMILAGISEIPVGTYSGGQWGVSRTDIDGLTHLEGESATYLLDGLTVGSGTVSSGEVTNAAEYYIGCCGLPYTPTYQSNPLNAQTPSGMAKGRIRRINEIALEFYKSLGVEYSNTGEDGSWSPVGVPEGVDDTVLFTGTVPNLTFEGKLDYDGYLYLRQTKPYSMNLLGIYMQAEMARQ
jgi:hypothetical protein